MVAALLLRLWDRPSRRLARAAAGDAAALGQLYDEHIDGLYAFVFYRVGGDASLAEDVVQETFTRALGRRDEYDAERGTIAAWLCTLSRNVIRDQLRSHRRGAELAASWERIDHSLGQIFAALAEAPLPGEVLARHETRDLVHMTIANLPETYRRALTRKYIDGDSLEKVAADLGLSPEAAKSLLARARRAFREVFATVSQTYSEAAR